MIFAHHWSSDEWFSSLPTFRKLPTIWIKIITVLWILAKSHSKHIINFENFYELLSSEISQVWKQWHLSSNCPLDQDVIGKSLLSWESLKSSQAISTYLWPDYKLKKLILSKILTYLKIKKRFLKNFERDAPFFMPIWKTWQVHQFFKRPWILQIKVENFTWKFVKRGDFLYLYIWLQLDQLTRNLALNLKKRLKLWRAFLLWMWRNDFSFEKGRLWKMF